MPAIDDVNPQTLTRCVVENSRAEHSIRFVEHSHYRLWQYLMANKHGLLVRGPPCAFG